MIAEDKTNLAKEAATTREVKTAKGVFIKRGTTENKLICHQMNTIRILKDKDMRTRINIQKLPNNKITPIRFERKEDAVATIVEVIENRDHKLSNTSPVKT